MYLWYFAFAPTLTLLLRPFKVYLLRAFNRATNLHSIVVQMIVHGCPSCSTRLFRAIEPCALCCGHLRFLEPQPRDCLVRHIIKNECLRHDGPGLISPISVFICTEFDDRLTAQSLIYNVCIQLRRQYNANYGCSFTRARHHWGAGHEEVKKSLLVFFL